MLKLMQLNVLQFLLLPLTTLPPKNGCSTNVNGVIPGSIAAGMNNPGGIAGIEGITGNGGIVALGGIVSGCNCNLYSYCNL